MLGLPIGAPPSQAPEPVTSRPSAPVAPVTTAASTFTSRPQAPVTTAASTFPSRPQAAAFGPSLADLIPRNCPQRLGSVEATILQMRRYMDMRFEQLSQARQAPDLDRMDGADDQQLEEADDQQLGGVDDQRQQVALRLVRFMFCIRCLVIFDCPGWPTQVSRSTTHTRVVTPRGATGPLSPFSRRLFPTPVLMRLELLPHPCVPHSRTHRSGRGPSRSVLRTGMSPSTMSFTISFPVRCW